VVGVTQRITSLSNPTVKAVRALHLRKERDETGLFVAEGLKNVTEGVEQGHAPRILLYGPEAADHPLLKKALAATRAAGGEAIEVTEAILSKVSRRDNPQAVVGVFRQTFRALDQIEPQSATCWVALHRVRDPGNLGTIVRTADAAGADAVVVVGGVDAYHGKAVRASAGSLFHLPLVLDAGWDETAAALQRAGLATFATTGRGADDLDDLADDGTLTAPTAWLFGSEAAGLPEAVIAAATRRVRVPIHGRAESLNLAAAAAVCLYASARAQRRG
jgi:TrmH family RNA methyltransferase